MTFIIRGPLKDNVTGLMRSASYHFLGRTEKAGEMSFVRPLAGAPYPRFHLYIKIDGSDLILNLHLDQKKPSYGAYTDHSGEYNGKTIEDEAERIKRLLTLS